MTPAHPQDRKVLGALGQYQDDPLVRAHAIEYARAARRARARSEGRHTRVTLGRQARVAITGLGAGIAAGYLLVMFVLRVVA